MASRVRTALLILFVGFTALVWWNFQIRRDALLLKYPDPAQVAYRDMFIGIERAKALQFQFLILFIGAASLLVVPRAQSKDFDAEVELTTADLPRDTVLRARSEMPELELV